MVQITSTWTVRRGNPTNIGTSRPKLWLKRGVVPLDYAQYLAIACARNGGVPASVSSPGTPEFFHGMSPAAATAWA